MKYIEVSELTYCEDIDRHPDNLAVIMDTEYEAFWCQTCIGQFAGTQDEFTEYIPVVQPS